MRGQSFDPRKSKVPSHGVNIGGRDSCYVSSSSSQKALQDSSFKNLPYHYSFWDISSRSFRQKSFSPHLRQYLQNLDAAASHVNFSEHCLRSVWISAKLIDELSRYFGTPISQKKKMLPRLRYWAQPHEISRDISYNTAEQTYWIKFHNFFIVFKIIFVGVAMRAYISSHGQWTPFFKTLFDVFFHKLQIGIC